MGVILGNHCLNHEIPLAWLDAACSEITQTHVHRLGDAIQPPHPLSTLSVFNLTQHQGIFFLSVSQFFTSGAQSLELKLQHQSFQ